MAASVQAAHGAHVLLDFVNFYPSSCPAEQPPEDMAVAELGGEWMLHSLRAAVANHGVREVHSKLVVLGADGTSPPGFTAVTLLDESHVTAHCYSDRGWLAIDVFTCGAHDPRPLAADIRDSVEAYAPGVRCVKDDTVGRFLHFVPTTPPIALDTAPPPSSGAKLPSLSSGRVHIPVRSLQRGLKRRTPPSVMLQDAPGGDNGQVDPIEAAGAEEEEEDSPSELLGAFANRLEEEGGATKLQARSEMERAGRVVKDSSAKAGRMISNAIDLDSQRTKTARPQGGDGLLDTNSWRLTVGFFVLTIALALFTGARTDFSGSSTADNFQPKYGIVSGELAGTEASAEREKFLMFGRQ